MSNLVFPFTLPGIKIDVEREAVFNTIEQKTLSRKRLAFTYETYPTYRYTLSIEFMRAGTSFLEFQKLFGFLARHGARADTFLFSDPEDAAPYASSGAAGVSHYFGVGNASTTDFQLQRTLVADADLAAASSRAYWPTLGDGYEPVFELNGSPSIYVGGVLKTITTDYTLPGNGVVHFVAAPAGGALLSWSGAFYRRVTFEEDSLSAQRLVQSFWDTKQLVLVSVKQ